MPTTPEQPETILYSYLTTPRSLTPRWYHEGAAVFLETWMAGGRGRAQSAWDEMVFRSMVRDGSRFYDPLGLVSEGTKVDFQLEANSYLYGERFMTFLAYRYSPEQLVGWVGRREGSKALLRLAVPAGLRPVDPGRLAGVDRLREGVPEEEPRRDPGLPDDAVQGPLAAGPRRRLAGLLRPGHEEALRRLQLPRGRRPRRARSRWTTGRWGGSPRSRARSATSSPRSPSTPGRRRSSTRPTTRLPRRAVARPEYRASRRSSSRRRGSASSSSTGPTGRSGACGTLNGIATLVRIPSPYTEWKQVRSWPYGEIALRHGPLPRREAPLGLGVGEINGQHTLQVMKTEALLAGDATPVATTDFGGRHPDELRLLSRRKARSTGARSTPAWRTSSAANPATGEQGGPQQHRDGLLPPRADARRLARSCSASPGEGFVPARIEARATEDVSAITFLGNEVIVKHPVAERVEGPAALRRSPSTRS